MSVKEEGTLPSDIASLVHILNWNATRESAAGLLQSDLLSVSCCLLLLLDKDDFTYLITADHLSGVVRSQ